MGAAGSSPVGGRPLTIGQLLGLLRPQFPGLTHSKVRFLEEQGLVRPARTAGGYRSYGAADVERLRRVLALQRDDHLPLRVIAERLGSGLPAPVPGLTGGDGEQVKAVGADAQGGRRRVRRAELDDAAGGRPDVVDDLLAHGLLVLDDAGTAAAPALGAVRVAAALAAAGIHPRHLHPARSLAAREAALVGQLTGPLRRGGDRGGGPAEEREAELVALLVELHAHLLRSVLRDAAR